MKLVLKLEFNHTDFDEGGSPSENNKTASSVGRHVHCKHYDVFPVCQSTLPLGQMTLVWV